MRQRGARTILKNNVVIGVITVLVLVLMVFIAGNANQGLPFVPTYDIEAEVPDASGLLPNNEVKIAGLRVGFVKGIETVAHEDGSYTVLLSMKLDETARPVYKNASVQVRQTSTLGLKYLGLEPGTPSAGAMKEGETIPLASSSTTPVELQDWFNIFDKKTRDDIRISLRGIGGALAGRGTALNETIQVLPSALENLEPVAETLAEPATGLERFFISLGEMQAQLAPAAQSFASLFVNLDTTFGALAGVTTELQQMIEKTPSTFSVSTKALRSTRPFLRRTTELSAELRPSFSDLRDAAPDLADTATAGKEELPRAPAFNRRLDTSLRTIEDFAEDANVPLAVDALESTAAILNPYLAFVTPAQTTCNYLTLFFRNASGFLSEGSPGVGNWIRFAAILAPQGPNNLGFPASAPADGPELGNYLHSNPYPNTAAPGQDNECEAGREWYTDKQKVIGNVPGNQGQVTEGR